MEKIPNKRNNLETLAILLEDIASVANGLGISEIDKIKNIEVLALYDLSNNRHPYFLGFIRPSDKIELEK